MRSYLIISTLIIFLSTLFFMVAVLLRKRLNRQSLAFSAFGFSVAWWSLSYILWQFSSDPTNAIFWCRMLVLGSAFIPVTYLQFVCNVTDYPRPRIILFAYALASMIALLNLGPFIVSHVEPVSVYPYWPIAGSAFYLYLGHFVLFVLYSFYLLLKKLRTSSPQVRNQLQYLIIGTALGYAGCSTNFFYWIGIPIGPVGQGLGILYILGIGYSVIKYRLLEFNELFLRMVGILFAALGLSWLFSLVTYFYVFDLPYQASSPDFLRYWIILGFFTVSLFLILPGLNRAFEQMLAWILQNGRTGYRTQLKNLAGKLGQMEDEKTIFEELILSLQKIIPARRLAVYYRSDFETQFTLRSASGDQPFFPDSIPQDMLLPIQARMMKSTQSIHFGELSDREIQSMQKAKPDSIPSVEPFLLNDDLLVPLTSGNVLDGFLVLGSRMDGKIYTEVDISLLEYLCSQIALAIRSRKIERRATQVDNLVSLGTLAAGLAHELKNPLVSIKTLGSMLQSQEPGEDSNWTRDQGFIDVVQRDIDRISSIIENVAIFAENQEIRLAPVNPQEVIAKTQEIESHRFEQEGVTFICNSTVTTAIQGNFSQLVQVFLNLFENSLAAMSDTPDKILEVRCSNLVLEEGTPWVEISVIDSGEGISEALISRVFDPFITTKATGTRTGKSGSGLGLAIVKRIVEAHRGIITIENHPPRGTHVRIRIPGTRDTPVSHV